MQKKSFWIYILIAVALPAAIIFVNASLKEKEVKVVDKQPAPKVKEIHPAKITLNIVVDDHTITTYTARLETKDTIGELLEYLRKNDNFTYEKVAYVHGTEIDDINGIKASENQIWTIRMATSGEDITFKKENVFLEDKQIYTITLENRQ
jgi:hypothetical protein